ncbi:hypothetical protein KC614_05125, partial [candidate division WWE3 bacterium]|nr:hypothetical protein [candidate division WWE3 bacterium]
MRLIFSEYPAEYESYRFPYQVWGVQEDDDDADDALELGFMPSRMKIGLWYLGRSLRISMKRFKENSENR